MKTGASLGALIPLLRCNAEEIVQNADTLTPRCSLQDYLSLKKIGKIQLSSKEKTIYSWFLSTGCTSVSKELKITENCIPSKRL